jgi:formylglycine-generating enzyme required for sulfatase activity
VAWASPEHVTVELAGGTPPIALTRLHAGTFKQGSPADERKRASDESLHNTTLSHDVYIADWPVTRGQFARFVAATSYKTESERGKSGGYGVVDGKLVQRPDFNWRAPGFAQTDQHPAVLITFADAEAFTRWLSQQSGRVVRLPTEAEWEMACRAGTETAWYGALDEQGARALGYFDGGEPGTHPLGQRRPNGLRLHDMVGHVRQWTLDVYAPYSGDATDPRQTATTGAGPERRVLRGGSFLTNAASGRCAARGHSTAGTRAADVGFRVVVEDDGRAEAPVSVPPTVPPPVPTPVVQPTSDPSIFPWLAGGGVLVFFAWLFGRKKSAPAGKGGLPPGAGVRLVASSDGFRVHAPESARGHELRYRYRDGDQDRDGVVRIEPSPAGQFVYTGATPVSLTLLGVTAANMTSTTDPGPTWVDNSTSSTTTTTTTTSTSSSTNYPSAY